MNYRPMYPWHVRPVCCNTDEEYRDYLRNRRALLLAAIAIILAGVFLFIALSGPRVLAAPQTKKLPEGQTCSNTYDTDEAHKCSCMAEMKCPMKKPEPCYDEEGDCPPPENGPDSTKCISPNCKKDACKCANPCKS